MTIASINELNVEPKAIQLQSAHKFEFPFYFVFCIFSRIFLLLSSPSHTFIPSIRSLVRSFVCIQQIVSDDDEGDNDDTKQGGPARDD